ncbi:conotoxin [Pantoea sp. EA-12]|uniref:conotoxin n=1 Tax=Pantoea sp. EA-12 TaxID=3043303 RepID=UPI0024B5AB31|nr:conotoxin [Pantoea sp. EA-12]MDI9222706.1 conotoxin [Pantoea sp. EA-12]
MKLPIVFAALFLATTAHAEITLTGKPDNQFTQDAHKNIEARKKMLSDAKIDRSSFSKKVQQTCDITAPQEAVDKFHKMTKQILGYEMSFEEAGYNEKDYRKVISFSCYKGANWTINGMDKQMEPQLVKAVKDHQEAAKTMTDKATAEGYRIAIEATQQGMVAARK